MRERWSMIRREEREGERKEKERGKESVIEREKKRELERERGVGEFVRKTGYKQKEALPFEQNQTIFAPVEVISFSRKVCVLRKRLTAKLLPILISFKRRCCLV